MVRVSSVAMAYKTKRWYWYRTIVSVILNLYTKINVKIIYNSQSHTQIYIDRWMMMSCSCAVRWRCCVSTT